MSVQALSLIIASSNVATLLVRTHVDVMQDTCWPLMGTHAMVSQQSITIAQVWYSRSL